MVLIHSVFSVTVQRALHRAVASKIPRNPAAWVWWIVPSARG
jgi:hypothetical protein